LSQLIELRTDRWGPASLSRRRCDLKRLPARRVP